MDPQLTGALRGHGPVVQVLALGSVVDVDFLEVEFGFEGIHHIA